MKNSAAAKETLRRLYVYNGGFLTQPRIRRILKLAGYDISVGKPGDGDAIGVWGQSPTAPRGEAIAARTDTPIIRIEDAFLRSVLTGRDGEPGLGLLIDQHGVHFDPSTRSDLERLLSEHPLDDTALLDRARDGIDWIVRKGLSKYNAHDGSPPEPGYVLVIDQTRKDASVRASGADLNTFREMLYYAQEEHPGTRILIKTHPETAAGHRDGYYSSDDETDRITLLDAPVAPQDLFDGAVAVYTVSSQMGFEAILVGHKPIVFGQPFYVGWGLTDDRKPLDRRQRSLTKAQLFAAAMILYPTWYDPFRDSLCEVEDVLAILEAKARAWRDDHKGWQAAHMRLWKRKPLQQVFGRYRKVRFKDSAPTDGRRLMVWAGRCTPELASRGAVRVEDGLIRSRGLGADLTPPLSLVLDDIGIYYDPRHPSRLEELIEASPALPSHARRRAQKLIRTLTENRITKYNLTRPASAPDIPKGRRILVPGQVEDDASILLGASEVKTNAELLKATRAANPAAVLIYKPHPDVEAGLRKGDAGDALGLADVVLKQTDTVTALDLVDDVWTMTSTLGFEALLRGKSVTCLGMPFYAGWGLTDDRPMPITRRSALPDLASLVHAVLIEYPRYFDPVTGDACPVEVVVERLMNGELPSPGPFNRSLAKLQGLFASYAWIWR